MFQQDVNNLSGSLVDSAIVSEHERQILEKIEYHKLEGHKTSKTFHKTLEIYVSLAGIEAPGQPGPSTGIVHSMDTTFEVHVPQHPYDLENAT